MSHREESSVLDSITVPQPCETWHQIAESLSEGDLCLLQYPAQLPKLIKFRNAGHEFSNGWAGGTLRTLFRELRDRVLITSAGTHTCIIGRVSSSATKRELYLDSWAQFRKEIPVIFHVFLSQYEEQLGLFVIASSLAAAQKTLLELTLMGAREAGQHQTLKIYDAAAANGRDQRRQVEFVLTPAQLCQVVQAGTGAKHIWFDRFHFTNEQQRILPCCRGILRMDDCTMEDHGKAFVNCDNFAIGGLVIATSMSFDCQSLLALLLKVFSCGTCESVVIRRLRLPQELFRVVIDCLFLAWTSPTLRVVSLIPEANNGRYSLDQEQQARDLLNCLRTKRGDDAMSFPSFTAEQEKEARTAGKGMKVEGLESDAKSLREMTKNIDFPASLALSSFARLFYGERITSDSLRLQVGDTIFNEKVVASNVDFSNDTLESLHESLVNMIRFLHESGSESPSATALRLELRRERFESHKRIAELERPEGSRITELERHISAVQQDNAELQHRIAVLQRQDPWSIWLPWNWMNTRKNPSDDQKI